MTKLGYLVPTREQIMQEAHGTDELIRRAQFARDKGFDSLWVGDSLFARPRHDPLTLLAALAVATPGMELGTAILLQQSGSKGPLPFAAGMRHVIATLQTDGQERVRSCRRRPATPLQSTQP